jgi:thiol-disulfide isomerase/thioredoxin
MKTFRFLLICALAMMQLTHLFAQHYVYQKTEGASPHLGHIRATNDIIVAPAADMLSEWQELPFEWSFYGKQVEGFYVSVNGYITFDKSEKVNAAVPVPIPDPAGPNDAIYVCWAEWELVTEGVVNPGKVYSWLSGDAPGRTLGIAWIGLSPAIVQEDSPSRTNLFLFIHEQGDFEILTRSSIRTDVQSLAGVEDARGERAISLFDGLTTNLPARTFRPNQDVSWVFEYSEQTLSARVISTNLKETATVTQEQEIVPVLWNTGSESIHSFTLSYHFDEHQYGSLHFQDLNIPSNDQYSLNLDKEWMPHNPGYFSDITFQVTEINGYVVNEASYCQEVFVNLGRSAPKKVLFEEFTGTWCGWCPDGMVQLKEIMSGIDGIIPVAIHVRDTMEIQEGKALSEFYRPAYPEAMIDRVLWPKEPKVTVSRSEGAWGQFIQQALNMPAPLMIDMEYVFLPEARELMVTINTTFVDYAIPGDFRVHLLIIEDNVSDTHEAFNQANYYSGSERYADHPYYDLPRYIPGYVHHFLLRQAPSGAWGTPDVISAAPNPGDMFSHTYKLGLADFYDLNEISLIAFVSRHGATPAERNIINVSEMRLISSYPQDREQTSEVGSLFLEALRRVKNGEYGGTFYIEAARKLDTLEIIPPDFKHAGMLYLQVNKRAESSRYLESYLSHYPWEASSEIYSILATNYGYAYDVKQAEYYYSEAMKLLTDRNQTLTLGRGRMIDEMDMSLLIAYYMNNEIDKAIAKGKEIEMNLNTESPETFQGMVNLFQFYPASLVKQKQHDTAIAFLENQISKLGEESGLGQWAMLYKIMTRYDQLLEHSGKTDAIAYFEGSRNMIQDIYVLRRFDTNLSHARLIGEKMSNLIIDDWLSEIRLSPGELEGKVIILDFWATWCGPCRASFPKMNAIYDQYKDDGLIMAGITKPYGYVSFPEGGVIRDLSYEEELRLTAQFVKDMNLAFPQIMDKEGRNFAHFGASYLPTIIVIDRDGIIRYIGYLLDESTMHLIRELVGQS